jgi:hypothetical protein
VTSTPPEGGTDGPDRSIDAAGRQAREQAKRDVIGAVLGAGLAAVDLTTEATFKPTQRTELPGESPAAAAVGRGGHDPRTGHPAAQP